MHVCSGQMRADEMNYAQHFQQYLQATVWADTLG